MFERRRVSRAQARRDREWQQFVRDLTEPAGELSPAEDERMRAFLDAHADAARSRAGEPAESERAA
jgi:hypothetical protein